MILSFHADKQKRAGQDREQRSQPYPVLVNLRRIIILSSRLHLMQTTIMLAKENNLVKFTHALHRAASVGLQYMCYNEIK